MRPFNYVRPAEIDQAISVIESARDAKFVAGGTTMLDLMKLYVENPTQLIDVNSLPLSGIETTQSGVKIGALARMSEVAEAEIIRDRFPCISEALLASASPQLRNMASLGGNLMQRTRCSYFRDPVFPCNKRQPDSGCPAFAGENRMHAILGTSDFCCCTHASDLAVALIALDAVIYLRGKKGDRSIPIAQFYLLPGNTPARETVIESGELIVAVEVPDAPHARNSHYLKIRDRASYEFALVSVAVGLEIKQNIIQSARVALGGVASIPWRAFEVEEMLQGKSISEETFSAAAEIALKEAKPQTHNEFKIELAKRALVRALSNLGKKHD